MNHQAFLYGIFFAICVPIIAAIAACLTYQYRRRTVTAQTKVPIVPVLFRRTNVIVSSTCASIDYDVELTRIQSRIRRWHYEHPFGPTNNKEMLELEWLTFEEAGTIVARSGDLKCAYSMDTVEEIISEIEDWKI